MNVHQDGAKHCGNRVWGWVNHWWIRVVADARHAGADFARAFFAILPFLAAAAPAAPAPVMLEVPRWERHEFMLHGRALVENPFRDAALVGEFNAPSGRAVMVEGFYDGQDTWRLRFVPDEEGEWRYRLRGEAVELHEEGRLRCTAPRTSGFIRIHPENPYAFAYASGAPFFPMGDTSYGFYSDTSITPELRDAYLRKRRAQRFNFVRMGVVHSPTHWESDPAYWPWGGTSQAPDLDRLNPRYFAGLDAVLTEMMAAGMNAELIVLNFYQPPFTDPNVWTQERERRWLRYLLARYAGFSNVFLWTISNEYETHPNGAYRLDFPDDPDWVKATARFIKEHDPYRHPVTVHPVVSSSTHGRSPGDPFDPPWRIGRFFGDDDALDVLSQQTGQSGTGVTWDDTLRCWIGDDPNLVASLRADRRYNRPVLNTESGYEYLRGQPTYNQQVHSTDKVRHSAWRIVCAGGYFAAGFAGTLGMGDYWNTYGPEHYPFMVRDEGAAGHLGTLYDFFTTLPFWRMQPFPEVTGEMAVALAEPAKVYVVYLPHGRKVEVDLSAVPGPFEARWFDPRHGRFGEGFPVEAAKKLDFAAPDENDWILRLKASR